MPEHLDRLRQVLEDEREYVREQGCPPGTSVIVSICDLEDALADIERLEDLHACQADRDAGMNE